MSLRRGSIPVPLFIGVVIGVLGSAASAFSWIAVTRRDADSVALDFSLDEILRWSTFDYACSLAGLLMSVIAFYGASKRATGIPRVMLLIVVSVLGAVTFWYVAQPVVSAIYPELQSNKGMRYVWQVLGIGTIGATIALAIGCGAFARPSWVTVFAVLGILAAVFHSSTPILGGWVWEGLTANEGPGSLRLLRLYWPIREAIHGAAVIAMVYAILRDAPPAIPDPHLARVAFQRAAVALIIRVVAAVAIGVLTAGVVRTAGANSIVGLVVPIATTVSMLVFAWALLDVGRAALAEVPPVRLAIGAAVSAWAAGIQLLQTTLSQSYTRMEEHGPPAWSIAAPLISIGGMLFVISAIAGFARARGDERLRSSAIARAPIYALLSVGTVLLPFSLEKIHDRNSQLMMLIAILGCAIAAIVVLAQLMSRVAASLENAPAHLPEARLRR